MKLKTTSVAYFGVSRSRILEILAENKDGDIYIWLPEWYEIEWNFIDDRTDESKKRLKRDIARIYWVSEKHVALNLQEADYNTVVLLWWNFVWNMDLPQLKYIHWTADFSGATINLPELIAIWYPCNAKKDLFTTI